MLFLQIKCSSEELCLTKQFQSLNIVVAVQHLDRELSNNKIRKTWYYYNILCCSNWIKVYKVKKEKSYAVVIEWKIMK